MATLQDNYFVITLNVYPLDRLPSQLFIGVCSGSHLDPSLTIQSHVLMDAWKIHTEESPNFFIRSLKSPWFNSICMYTALFFRFKLHQRWPTQIILNGEILSSKDSIDPTPWEQSVQTVSDLCWIQDSYNPGIIQETFYNRPTHLLAVAEPVDMSTGTLDLILH